MWLRWSPMKVTSDEISSAAAIVALASAIFTGISLRWAKQSADAAGRSATAAEQSAGTSKKSLDLQAGLDTPESPPRLTGAVKLRPGGPRDLVITLDSDRALTSMDVSLAENAGIWFIPYAPGVHPEPPDFIGTRSFRAFTFDLATGRPAGLQPHSSAQWGVTLADGDHPPATLRITADCRGEGDLRWPAVEVIAHVDPARHL
jgi:hypothetical protein